MHDEFVSSNIGPNHRLDTGDETADTTTDRILAALASGRLRYRV